jgi:replicative DNA helicase
VSGGQDFGGGWTTIPIAEALARTLDHIEQKGTHSLGTSVSSGYPDLDAETGGLPAGALTLIAGAPGVGKTALALAICRHIATKRSGEVLYVTGTDPIEALMMRLLSYEANVPVREISRGRLRRTSWSDLGSAVKLLSELPLSFLEDTHGSIDNICAAAAAIERERSLGAVFVDPVSSVKGWSDDPIAVGSVLSRLRRMAIQHAVPVVLVTQSIDGDRLEQVGKSEMELSVYRELGRISDPTGGPTALITVHRAQCAPVIVHMEWDDAYVWIRQLFPAGRVEMLRSESGDSQRDRAG